MNKTRLLAAAAFVTLPAASAMAQAVAPAPAETPAAEATAASDVAGDIIVTARRSNERLQNVPIAVSVLTPTTLNSKGTFTPMDLTANVPGLSVMATVADRNNVTYSIRGQGYAFGTLFPAVVTYFNEVPITQLTAGQFFDLANVQVLRGPQGVNFGRVTDGGNVMVAAQEPKNEFGGYAQVKLGDYAAKVFNGALNVPIVEDRVLLRGAFEIGRRDGFTKNLFNGQKLDGQHYESYRAGLKLNITDTLTNTTTVAYQRTNDSGTTSVVSAVNPLALARNYAVAARFPGVYGIDSVGNVVPFQPGLTPFTAANLIASQQAQLAAQQARGPRKVFQAFPSFDRRKNLYVVNATKADLTDNIQLTNIFGYVDIREDQASGYSGTNGNVVSTCHRTCGTGSTLLFRSQKQYSEELRLAGKAFDNHLTWAIGGYADEQNPGGRLIENDTINVSILERDGVQYTTTTSRAAYASGEYDLEQLLPGLKINGGIRYTHDTVDSRTATYVRPVAGTNGQQALAAVLTQVLQLPPAQGGRSLDPATAAIVANGTAAATYAPIPHGQCTDYGTLNGFTSVFGASKCTDYEASFNATTWQAGISYKNGSGPLFYARASKGYRPGGINGSSPANVDPTYNPEFDVSVEIGMKSQFNLGGATVRANIAAYRDRYTNIQKTVVLPGAVPLAVVRNVNDAKVQGIEFDGAIVPFQGLTFGGSFAYTDAKYDKNVVFDASACDPTSTAASTSFCPFNRFGNTPKFQYTLNLDYTLPLNDDIGKVSFGAQWYHQSSLSFGDASTIAPRAIEKPYGYLDINVTWANVTGRPVDLGFFMSNVTNKLYRIGSNDLTQNSSVGIASNIYAAPRMFGFSLKYRIGSDAN